MRVTLTELMRKMLRLQSLREKDQQDPPTISEEERQELLMLEAMAVEIVPAPEAE